MRYSFNDYKFDSKSLVLTKQGETVNIRHNEAKVLALLITQKDQVISKDDILSDIWKNKVVSEQTVFQNISHLRGLFGNNAIKTFSKRGYQWTLDTQTDESVESNDNKTTEVAPPIPQIKYKRHNLKQKAKYSLLVTGICILVIFAFLNSGTNKGNTRNLAYIPFSYSDDSSPLTIPSRNELTLTELGEYETYQYRASSILEYQSLKQEHPLILTGEIRHHSDKYYLDFNLQGPYGEWSGLLSGRSQQQTEEQLWQQLQQIFIYKIVNEQQPLDMQQAILAIAHQSSPEDLNILSALAKVYLQLGQTDHAMIMAKKMQRTANAQDNLPQLGQAYLLQSQILTNTDLVKLSAEKLALAIDNFELSNDLKGQADAWFANSWLEHQFDNYSGVKDSLLTSAKLALTAKDIARELNALTYLAVMAHKHNEINDRYSYLKEAENKMLDYELPTYHFAKVPYHYAIYANSPLDKEPHYKRVLEVTKMTPDHWVAQVSRKALVEFYISQKRLNEATQIVHPRLTDNAQNSYLKAIIATAKGQTDLFEEYAQKAFEQAKLSGEQTLSLDIALLLCSQESNQHNYSYYSQYIADNATVAWRRENKKELLTLNLL